MAKKRKIEVNYLARVEGEGALHVELEGKKVKTVQLRIFEPPRFFEAFLKGREYSEAPDITARICGICPIAYQMTSVQAMESILRVKISPEVERLRRLIYLGEWIESHGLHTFMLHAPDFLGFEDSIQMAKASASNRAYVEKGLSVKKLGNEIMTAVGGREIHPINIKVGGLYRFPKKRDLDSFLPNLDKALKDMIHCAKWFSTFTFPELNRDYEFVSTFHEKGEIGEYPIMRSRVISSKGLDIFPEDYEKYFEESHASYTHALHSVLKGRGSYFVGPLARYNLAGKFLDNDIKKLAADLGLETFCQNPFKSLLVRAVEMIFSLKECKKLILEYQPGDRPSEDYEVRPGVGMSCTEAPRGLIYHRYEIDQQGLIEEAKIVPPTSQNQKMIEDDLYQFIGENVSLNDEELTWKCEQAIRNYDPCISCATHFLNMSVSRQ